VWETRDYRKTAALVIDEMVGTITLDEVSADLGEQGLDRYKHPERIELVDQFPSRTSARSRRVF
jgi:non-ribosomal peptide synthetase component E (peptide arylation enzyme)